MADPYRAFRQYERKIFRGVPELPESAQRDNAHVTERLTGQSQFGRGFTLDFIARAKPIVTIVYDDDAREMTFERVQSDAVAERPEVSEQRAE